MYSGCPATVPPTRRPTDVRKTSDSQISHAIPPVQESTHAQIPQNINDSITRSEIQSGELHAKLQSTARLEAAGGTCHGAGGRRRGLAGLRANAPHISDLAPLVWRAPEGPEGTGGLRGAAPNEVRTPSLAGGRALRRPEHQRRHKQQHGTGARARRPAPPDATTQTRTIRSTCVRSRSAHAARQSRRSSRSLRLRRRAGPRR